MKLVSIRINILAHFVLLILFSALLLLGVQYYFNSNFALKASEENFRELFERVEYRNLTLNQQNQAVLHILQRHPELKSGADHDKLLKIFSDSLVQFPKTYAIYLASKNDEFFEVINMAHSDKLQQALQAPPQTVWTAIQVYPQRASNNYHYRYYNADLELISEKFSTTNYSASQRPWFRNALNSQGVFQSSPYLFWHLKAPGVTFSKKISDDAVIAIDYTIDQLTDLFQTLKPSADSQILLFDQFGEIYFQSNLVPTVFPLKLDQFQLSETEKNYIATVPLLTVSNQQDWAPFDFVQNGSPNGFSVVLLKSIAQQLGLKIQFVNGYTWDELLNEFKNGRIDIMHSLLRSDEREKIGIFSEPYYPINNYLITHRNIASIETVAELSKLRFALGRGWQSTELILQAYPKLQYALYEDLPAMIRAVNSGEADVLIDNADTFARSMQKYQLRDIKLNQKLEKFLLRQEHLHFFAQEKYGPLIEILNRAINAISVDSMQALQKSWYLGANRTNLTISPYEVLFYRLLNQLPTKHEAVFYRSEVAGETYLNAVIPIEYNNQPTYLATFVPLSSLLAPYRQELYLSLIALSFALLVILWLANYSSNMIVRPINELMKRNELIAKREFSEVTPVDTHIKELAELSETLMKVSKSFKEYEQNQESFLEGLVKLIAEALDKRSHHTYSHCSRVPKLGIMILQAAMSEQEGFFKDFTMSDREEKAFELGAWLHDSGKITTPESILEKSTKLDAFYNRIHEIRMRFEVLWRDAEIEYWQQLADTEDEVLKTRLQRNLQLTQQRLQEEFKFVARLNIGAEPVTEEILVKLDRLGERTWTPHFEKTLGLSKFQLLSMPQQNSDVEMLLQDFPEQIRLREQKDFELYKEQGFAMQVPSHESNLGEKYNLSIIRGTLNPEERFKMEEHVVMTLRLLEKLPLPKYYKNIPKYAGTHHEKLDGSGYPRKLTADQLGVPERIMVLADIFEALTAPDRPYKRTHKLSKALDIIYGMVQENKIDADVFELFLRSGVYMEYAAKFIHPSQIDEVDIEKYFS